MNRGFINTRNKPGIERAEKIKMLQSIKEGKQDLSILKEPGYYCFVHSCDNPGIYELGDKRFTEQEYNEFRKTLSQKDQVHIIYFEDYSESDIKKIRE